MTNPTRPADIWSPQYFLSSVGAGGLAVSFFLWLLMWVPHPGQQVPTFEDIARAFATGGMLQQAMIAAALVAIAAFAFLNIKLLIWNIGRLAAFRRSPADAKLRSSNREAKLLTLPLALAMSINVGFVLGLTFVPGLWSVVEYLFPLAILAFLAVGVLALAQLGRFYGRIFGKGGFDWAGNTSFVQAMPSFALAMIGVGLAAPAAMSANPVTAGVSIVAASVFLVLSLLIGIVAVILGLASIAQHGANVEGAPSLTIVVPLTTVLGILMLRVNHGLGVHFEAHTTPGETLSLLSLLLGVQVAFLLFGAAVLRTQGYFRRFVTGPEVSASSYGLVCPGVAFSVLLQFFINAGLVGAGLIEKFGTAYWVLSGVAVVAQFATVVLVLTLQRKHFRPQPTLRGVPAE